jgi:hypothetical protein
MPLILRSITLFSSLIAASPLCFGPVMSVTYPGDRPEPVVTPLPVLTPAPDDCAVPELLVPGDDGDASLEALPAPLGSSPALLLPPGAAGPDGTPLMLCEPAPAEPALGDPAALPLLLPAEPPDDPPELWAREATGIASSAIAVSAAADVSFIGNLLLKANDSARSLFRPERFQCRLIDGRRPRARCDHRGRKRCGGHKSETRKAPA